MNKTISFQLATGLHLFIKLLQLMSIGLIGTLNKIGQFEVPYFLSVMPWVPVIDKEFIPDAPIDLLESGRMNQKDILMGVNKDEGTAFVGT